LTPCPRCGRELPPTALDGLCPACLMRQALADDLPNSDSRAKSDSDSVIFTSSLSKSIWTLVSLVDDDEEFVTYVGREQTKPVKMVRLIVQKQPVAAADLRTARSSTARRQQALDAVRHPALAHVLDAGVTDDGHAFLVTPFVMAEYIDKAGANARAVLDQALDALRTLHSAGVTHGHVCGSTILAHRTAAGATAVVTGFAPLDPVSHLTDGIQRDLQQFQALAATVRA
jgi:hypothetical protein